MEDSLQQILAATAPPCEASRPAGTPLGSTLPVAQAGQAALAGANSPSACEGGPESGALAEISGGGAKRRRPREAASTREAAAAAGRDTMTADHVAAFLGVDRKSVYAAVLRNDIPHRRMGKRILFSRDALALWLRGTCKGSSESALR